MLGSRGAAAGALDGAEDRARARVLGFAGFSLIVSMLVPRWYPQFPGRGLRVFVITCVLLFVGMISAVIFIARETSEAEAKGTETTTEATTTTAATTTTTSAPASVKVTETEFKIALPKSTLAAGSYSLRGRKRRQDRRTTWSSRATAWTRRRRRSRQATRRR